MPNHHCHWKLDRITKTISRLKHLGGIESVARAIQHGQHCPFFKVNSFRPRLSDCSTNWNQIYDFESLGLATQILSVKQGVAAVGTAAAWYADQSNTSCQIFNSRQEIETTSHLGVHSQPPCIRDCSRHFAPYYQCSHNDRANTGTEVTCIDTCVSILHVTHEVLAFLSGKLTTDFENLALHPLLQACFPTWCNE